MLLQEFIQFIRKENLFQSKDKLLLAVSGGVDSVVLCELCHQAGYKFAMAHCNFQLRGEESERDENFVKSLGNKYQTEVFIKRFETEAYAAQHKCSIQVAARELRYQWFREIADSQKIVTAHHRDDNIETMLMNFLKGTGIAGLRGIQPKQDNIIRPVLFASKEDIKSFAEENKLQWVEDSSNATDHYTRNYIRHHIIPALKEIYPQVELNLASNLQRFREVELVYRQSISKTCGKLVEKKGEELHIPVLKLKKTEAPGTILFELVHPLGFTAKQVDEALALMESGSGKYVASATHRILKNRNWLIIAPLATEQQQHVLVEGVGEVRFEGRMLEVKSEKLKVKSVEDQVEGVGYKQQGLNIATLDASDITFPLVLRKWRPGDYFYPLGMNKKKKIARFLIDQKLSAVDKEKVWVVEMDKKILWVVGLRIDHRFRVTEHTENVITLSVP